MKHRSLGEVELCDIKQRGELGIYIYIPVLWFLVSFVPSLLPPRSRFTSATIASFSNDISLCDVQQKRWAHVAFGILGFLV